MRKIRQESLIDGKDKLDANLENIQIKKYRKKNSM